MTLNLRADEGFRPLAELRNDFRMLEDHINSLGVCLDLLCEHLGVDIFMDRNTGEYTLERIKE